MNEIINSMLRRAKKRGQLSMLFFVCGYVLLRVALAKAAAYHYQPQQIPSPVPVAYFAGTILGGIGFVYWILTCVSVSKAIPPIRESGQDIGWGLLVICIILGPLGAWICGGFLVHQYQGSPRNSR